MKTALPAIAVLLLGVLAFVNLSLLDTNSELEAQRSELRNQLLEQVTQNTNQRLAFQRQIDNLEDNLASTTNQITNLSQALQETREAADPNLEALREAIRTELEDDLRNDPTALARLSSQSISEEDLQRFARNRVDNLYADLLEELDIDENRKSLIREAFYSIELERNAARNPDGDMAREAMRELYSTEYVLEQLSSVMTESELVLLDEYEATLSDRIQRQTYNSEIAFTAPNLTDSNRNFLIDTMMEALHNPDNQPQFDPSTVRSDYLDHRLEQLEHVSSQLAETLTGEQLRAASNFIEQQRTSLEMVRAMNEARNDDQQ